MKAVIAGTLAFLLGVASATLAAGDEPVADELPRAHAGLTASLPEVDVARFPLGDPIPTPPAALATMGANARLRLLRLGDAKVILDVQPFDAQGEPIAAAFDEIARAFASRSGAEVAIDPRLVELLVTISNAFGGKPLTLVSGHREAGIGTRKSSYHTRGMAVDITIRGVKVRELRKAAARLGARGIGVYPTYIHVDARTDEPFYWVGGGRRWRPRYAGTPRTPGNGH